MCTSSTAVAAPIAAGPGVGPRADQDEHRTQPLAARGQRRPRLLGEPVAARGDELAEPVLDRGHPARQPGLGGVEDPGDRGRDGSSVHRPRNATGAGRSTRATGRSYSGREPEWIAMIPPASTV